MLGKETATILQQAGIHVNDPTGGFYLFLDFSDLKASLQQRGIVDSRMLCEKLLDECGIAILPGADFNRPDDELTARLSYVDFDGAKALAASYTIPLHEPLPPDFLKRYCSNVLDAGSAMAKWVKN